MSIDGQVLVIAFLAISLKLLVWAREADGVEVKDELHRNGACPLDGRPLRLRARALSAGPERLMVTASKSRGDKREPCLKESR